MAAALFLPTGRALDSADTSYPLRLLNALVGACIDPWRRMRLRVDGDTLMLDGRPLALSPKASVAAVSADALAAYDWAWIWPWPPPPPPGPALELRVPCCGGWALCAHSEGEFEQMLGTLRDAIDLSHGEASPFARWQFGETLGAGTFGTVRHARRRVTGEVCAVKVLSMSALDRQCDARRAIERERSVMERLQALPAKTPIVRLMEHCLFAGHLYFFLSPRCDGDLLQLLGQRSNGLCEAATAAATRGALQAIAAMHRLGVVHLDVKPQNLLYRRVHAPAHAATPADGTALFDTGLGGPAALYLADFGCARQLVARAAAAAPAPPAAMGRAPDRGRASPDSVLPAARGGWRALVSDGGGTLYFTAPEVGPSLPRGQHACSIQCVSPGLLMRLAVLVCGWVVLGRSSRRTSRRIRAGAPTLDWEAHVLLNHGLTPCSPTCHPFEPCVWPQDVGRRVGGGLRGLLAASPSAALCVRWRVRRDVPLAHPTR